MPTITFADAVRDCGLLQAALQTGLQALRAADRSRVSVVHSRRIVGSIDIDAATRQQHPHDPRWDYAVGCQNSSNAHFVHWIEVHPANSRHVDEVIQKQNWLRGWVSAHASKLHQLPAKYYWVASGRVALPPSSPQRRRLAQSGIHFAGAHLRLREA
jgi:hypothetical protein